MNKKEAKNKVKSAVEEAMEFSKSCPHPKDQIVLTKTVDEANGIEYWNKCLWCNEILP